MDGKKFLVRTEAPCLQVFIYINDMLNVDHFSLITNAVDVIPLMLYTQLKEINWHFYKIKNYQSQPTHSNPVTHRAEIKVSETLSFLIMCDVLYSTPCIFPMLLQPLTFLKKYIEQGRLN